MIDFKDATPENYYLIIFSNSQKISVVYIAYPDAVNANFNWMCCHVR